MLKRPAEEWLAELGKLKIPCGPINTFDKVFSDPQLLFRGMLAEVPHPTAGTVKMVASPMKLSQTPCDIKRHPPLLGEHTEELLQARFGLSTAEIESLRQNGVI